VATPICKQGAARLDKNLEAGAHIDAVVPHYLWQQSDDVSARKDDWANSEKVAKQVSRTHHWQQ